MTISTDTSTIEGTTIVIEDAGRDIAIDYSAYYDRIATAMETVATNSTTIANNTTAITTQLTAIADDIDRLRNLADHPSGPGIRTIQPYGYLGNAILYLLYIKQAQILEDGEASNKEQSLSLKRFNELLDEMFRDFDATRGGF
jgi:hypothetical protein